MKSALALAICLLSSARLWAQPPAPAVPPSESASASGTREAGVKTNELEMKYFSTRAVVRPNLQFTLVARIDLKPKMHVYAPNPQHYIPLQFEVDPSPSYALKPAAFPKPETLYLEAIQETVPAYRGSIQITQDIVMAGSDALQPVLNGGREVKISGHLKYQACDDHLCYLPRDIPLEWTLKVEPLDRSPEAIRQK